MKLTVFQASKGDCLLLESKDGKRVLVDGGMPDSYTKHVRPALVELGGEIDLLYVSHIDEDHIGGVEELLNDTFEWRRHEYQKDRPNTRKREPPPRLPKIKAIWHNGFDMQVGPKKADAITNALGTAAALFEGSPDEHDLAEAAYIRELATGVDSALRVSHRVSGEQLGIPLNEPWKGKLAMARDDLDPIKLGSLTMTVIGPYKRRLDELKKWWDRWLADVDNQDQLEEIRKDMVDDAKALESGDVGGFRKAIEARSLDFSNRTSARLRDHGITEPNLASLMLLVEEGGKTLLLTGDGSGEDIVEGLERNGHLKPDGGLHVDVLKVQHHGATANVQPEFCRRVTADHYILCGNGDHHNPEPDVVKVIAESRLDPDKRGAHAGADGPFKLWFNSSKQAVATKPRVTHMTKVEDETVKLARASRGRMKYRFLRSGPSIDIPV